MRASSLNSDTVTLVRETGTNRSVDGKIDYDAARNRVTLDPAPDLTPGIYLATVTTGARDLAGNRLPRNKEWHFEVTR